MIQFMLHCLGQGFDFFYRLVTPLYEVNIFFLNKLQLAVDDNQNMGSILGGLEMIAVLINRCTIYEKLYLGIGFILDSAKNLEKALALLYSAILRYLARATQFYAQRTAGTYNSYSYMYFFTSSQLPLN